jgi:rubrerythrin
VPKAIGTTPEQFAPGVQTERKEVAMPEFGSPFSGLAHGRKLTDDELIRAIRFMISAEYEAIQLYMQLAESTDNKLAIEVLKDIADEERVHAGEFLRLLQELAPEEVTLYAKGAEEVEEEIGKMRMALATVVKD